MRRWVARLIDRLAEALLVRLTARLVDPLTAHLATTRTHVAADVVALRADLRMVSEVLAEVRTRLDLIGAATHRQSLEATGRHLETQAEVRAVARAVGHLERRAFGTNPPAFRVPARDPRQFTMAERQ